MLSDWSRIIHFLMQKGTLELISHRLWEHVYISGLSILFAICAAVPLGVLLTRMNPRVAELILSAIGILQTVPSIALLAFMIPFLGIGTVPAISALFLYALLPIIRSTYTGIRNVNASVVEVGRGMGMTSWQILLMLEFPLSKLVIMSGIRVSTVLIIGWATLAAYIGAGGLGDLILGGFASLSNEYIVAGALPVTLLALLTDWLLGLIEKSGATRNIHA